MIQISLIILTLLGMIKAVFVSLDIDESYAVAQAFRLVSGDKLLYDMWEPHQLSAFLPAIFLYPFVKITGSTGGSVIFLRIVGILIHTAVGLFLYGTVSEKTGKKAAFLILCFHLNFLPKWVSMPEFELMHYWSLLMIFLLLYRFENKGKIYLPVLAGIFYVISGLCYPTMVLVYPVFLAALLRKKEIRKGALAFTIGALVPAIGFIGAVLTYLSPDKLKEFVGYIFLDASHTTETGLIRFKKYMAQLKLQGLDVLIALLIAAVIVTVISILFSLRKKKKISIYNIIVSSVFAGAAVLGIRALYEFLFANQNQFVLQIRYPLCLAGFILLAAGAKKIAGAEFWYGILPALISLPAILTITNMDTNTAYAKLMPGIVAGFVLAAGIVKGKAEEDRDLQLNKITVLCAASTFLLCFMICKLLLIRVTGCLPVTIKARMTRIAEGPARGIYVTEEPGNFWNENYPAIKAAVRPDQNVLYVGAEQLFYMTFCNHTPAPSVQGTATYNEMYEKYYEAFPEKMPDVIVLDDTFHDQSVYQYLPDNAFIFDWIDKVMPNRKEESAGVYRILIKE